MNVPRIMLAAPASGSGKTTAALGLLKLLSGVGQKAGAFKCGPDYIDPLFHKRVLGLPSKNLDLYFTGEERTRQLFLEDAGGRDIAIIEGVMGLFDGLGGSTEEASSYHLAKVLKAPIILVLPAHGCGRSLLPLIAGFLAYDTENLIRGVILNQISSHFYEMIKIEIEAAFPIKVLGFLPKMDGIGIESRHLGLKLPGEIADIHERIEKIAYQVNATLDIEAILAIARQAAPLILSNDGKDDFNAAYPPVTSKTPIGIAMDEAFCFYYEDNLKLLRHMGAELVPFSPIHDKELPKNIKGMILGGGYPELYAKGLELNKAMRSAVKQTLLGGMPSIAECGGFLYLHGHIMDGEGNTYKMAGVIKGHAVYTGKLVRFGYVELAEKQSLFLKEGTAVRGHEFHYFDSTNNGTACIAKKPVSDKTWECIHETRQSFWGFPHLYYESNPQYVKRFMERVRDYERT